MPGMTIMLAAHERLLNRQGFERGQQLMLHQDVYQAHQSFEGPLGWGHVGYPEYPLRSLEAGPCRIILEGRIYTLPPAEVEADLARLAELFVADDHPDRLTDQVRQWIRRADGEYVVALLYPARGRVAVFSDVLGRLPLYYFADEQRLILAREAKFVQLLKPNPDFDRVGCAQSLWVAYPLEPRTLFHDVRRAGGGFFLWAGSDGQRVNASTTALFTYNFDHKRSARNLHVEAVNIADLLVEACRQRGRHPEASLNIVSLSGGQDSRAAAAAFAKSGVEFAAATYRTDTASSRRDAAVAREVAEALGAKWQLFEAPKADAAAREELAWAKDGLNYLAMAYILGYLRQIVGRWGRRAVYISGDGGDKILPDLRAASSFASMDDLLATIVRKHAICPLEVAAGLVGAEPAELLADLRAILESYPEADLVQKSVHYSFYERGRQWLFEGEDRTRFYLWQSSPFYAFELLSECMSLPDSIKLDYRFYRMVQKALSPRLADIPDATVGLAPSSRWYSPKVRLVRHAVSLPRWLREPLRRAAKGPRKDTGALQELRQALRDLSPSLPPLVNPARLEDLLERNCPAAMHVLHTLAAIQEAYRTRVPAMG